MARSFRFRPRYRGLAIGSIATGGVIAGASAIAGALVLGAVGGGIGIALGALYLISPAWKLAVQVDDDAIEVTSRGERRFRLAWSEVKEVVASPSTKTCFVDGGSPERSLLIPGPGAPAPYDIEDRTALYDLVVAHVPKERIREVELLERSGKGAP